MPAIISHLMACLLLVQGVFGLCCHTHQHCDEQADCLEATAGCDHHEPEARHGAPCNCKVECHGVCIYLPGSRASLDVQPQVQPLDLIVTSLTQTGNHETSTLWRELRSRRCLSEPPVRLHLLNQVLLT